MVAMDKLIGKVDNDTYIIGHSLGCMAVIRYMERLPAGARIRGAMIVGGRVETPKKMPDMDPDDREVLIKWIGTPIDWKKVLSHTDNFTGVFSDDDPITPKGESERFKKIVGGRVIMKHAMGHFEEETTETLPDVLDAVLEAFNS
jgi:predicted alpha/beta hydrolase family esterase